MSKVKIRIVFKNTDSMDLEVDNPHIEWFVVDVNGRLKVFTYSHDVGKEL